MLNVLMQFENEEGSNDKRNTIYPPPTPKNSLALAKHQIGVRESAHFTVIRGCAQNLTKG